MVHHFNTSGPNDRVDAVPAFKQMWLHASETPTLRDVTMDGDTLSVTAVFDQVDESATDDEKVDALAGDVGSIIGVFTEFVQKDFIETPDRLEVTQATEDGDTWTWSVSADEARQHDAGNLSTRELLDRVGKAVEDAGLTGQET